MEHKQKVLIRLTATIFSRKKYFTKGRNFYYKAFPKCLLEQKGLIQFSFTMLLLSFPSKSNNLFKLNK